MAETRISIDKMSKEQLIQVILSLQNTQRNSQIIISDVRISSTEGLESCERSLDRILEKHKDFILKKEKQRQNILVGDLVRSVEDD